MLLALFLFLAPDLSQQPSATLAGFVHLVRGVGSPARSTAYPDLASALAAAVDGDFLILDPGLYTGPANRDLVVTKDVVIRGRYGPDTSIIDCEGLGRAFDFQGARALVEDLTIRGGMADWGGGARVSGGMASFKNVTFTVNYARFGGALYHGSSIVFLSQCRFIQNFADGAGGGVYAGSEGYYVDCTFDRNESLGAGGGLSVTAVGLERIQVDRSMFKGNMGASGGGAMVILYGKLFMDRCTFQDNQADGVGGGVGCFPFSSQQGILQVTNSLIVRNYARDGGGGAFVNSAGLWNCTVVENSSSSVAAGGVFGGNTRYPTVIMNCVVRGNSSNASTIGQQQILDTGTLTIPADQTLLYSNVEGITGLPTNFDAKPLFLDPANGDYHIAPSSPCVDAGFTYSLTSTQRDIDGEARFQGLSVDVGVDEVPVPTAP